MGCAFWRYGRKKCSGECKLVDSLWSAFASERHLKAAISDKFANYPLYLICKSLGLKSAILE